MIYLYNAIYASGWFCDLHEDKTPLLKHLCFDSIFLTRTSNIEEIKCYSNNSALPSTMEETLCTNSKKGSDFAVYSLKKHCVHMVFIYFLPQLLPTEWCLHRSVWRGCWRVGAGRCGAPAQVMTSNGLLPAGAVVQLGNGQQAGWILRGAVAQESWALQIHRVFEWQSLNIFWLKHLFRSWLGE